MLNSPRIAGSSDARTTWRAVTRAAAAFVALASVAVLAAAPAEAQGRRARLSTDLAARLAAGDRSGVDVFVSGAPSRLERLAARHGLRVKKALTDGAVFEVPAGGLEALAADLDVEALVADADVRSHLATTTATTGAEQVWRGLAEGLGRSTGRGVGVAVIDSGIAPHLAVGVRVVASVDFTSKRGLGIDQYGHGTHVGGIIAGQAITVGRTTAPSGMAPGAHLVNLKVLGADGSGKASSVVEAIDWAIRHKDQFAIRVLNLSLGAPVTAGCADDPLCRAVERAVRAGLVVVASAGNYGQTADGKTVLGSITSPGNSPFAITVGALRTQGTADRSDDEVAPWSSRGPTLFDGVVKPDLVAPGSRIVSAIGPGALLARQYPDRMVSGAGAHGYFAMSGTSMAAASVSGAAALLLESRPGLTPLQVKLLLQASATFLPEAGLIAGGAGSVNVAGAGRLTDWLPSGGPEPSATAYLFSVSTGATQSLVIVWGSLSVSGDVIVWGSNVAANVIVWGSSGVQSSVIVWGSAAASGQVIVWGSTSVDANVIVWGSSTVDSNVIVWGSTAPVANVIVWGSSVALLDWRHR